MEAKSLSPQTVAARRRLSLGARGPPPSRDTINRMEQAPAQQQTVLIVEDDQLLSGLLAVKMSKKFNTLAAGTGEAALETLKSATPDVVLLAILLPGIDGYEVLRRMKADPK